MKLESKVAVITGGNSGIGLEIARRFKSEGARVAILGRDRESLRAAESDLGPDAVVVQGDVSQAADLNRLYEQTVSKLGKINVLVVNAGVAQPTPIDQTEEETLDKIFDVNVKGAFLTIQRALPHLAEPASVQIVGSAVSYRGLSGMSIYSASKAAVRSFARTLSAELLPRGIRVNILSPGPIETPIYGRFGLPPDEVEKMGKQLKEANPMGRFGNTKEMANVALFLASDDSSYVAGADIVADGGWSQI